jgi:SAM-dependent methyltransferase
METAPTDKVIHFECNICGASCLAPIEKLQREVPSCADCGSSPRARAIIRALSLELFGENLTLPHFPVRREIRGLGMTDWEGYADRLKDKFSYTNTYYHQDPKLDVSDDELPESLLHSSDFVISSEIFEHVVPPVQQAFENTLKLIRPGGVFVLTVPYGTQAETIEHFPDLHDFKIVSDNDTMWLENVTRSGDVQLFNNLVFHGGPGSTLEMRVFAETALLHHLTDAGFEAVTVHRTPDLSHGIWWPEPWSLPLSARRPR